ncbi:MAG: DUF1266 domain-containing protein [Peptococcaceae bacterium]|nr:DUF1266 domain-containing protein [Peptococcaceae bacterium]
MKEIMDIIRILLNRNFPRNPEGETLSEAKQRALNVGAIMSGTRVEFCDSLETHKHGISEKERNALVDSRTAVATLDWLKNEGNRQIFIDILKNSADVLEQEPSFEDFLQAYNRVGLPILDKEILNDYSCEEVELTEKHINILRVIREEKSDEEMDRLIEENKGLFGEDDETFGRCIQIYGIVLQIYDRYISFTNNLKHALPQLQKHGFVAGSDHSSENACPMSPLASIDPSAWDMGRIVNVARWSYESGYISEAQAWEYIFFAEKECASRYANWEEFGKAYIIGRAMCDLTALYVFMDMVKRLLKDEKSPWTRLPLK